MKKKLLFIGVPLALVILIGGLLYRNFVTSPKYSLLKIKESLENHDISTFEKYVDINGIVVRLLTELPDILNIEKDAGFLGEEAMQLFTTVMQESITKVANESVRSFVERGHFDKQLTKKGVISKIIKDLPVDNLKISGLKEIRKEGKICKVPIDIFVAAYEGDFTLEFMMRDKGGYWQVAEISNLTDSIQQIADLKRTVPCRKLKETALYLARSLDSASDRARALMNIAESLAKAGKTDEADPVFSKAIETAASIKNAYTKAWALANIAESLATAGKTNEALETAGSIKDADDKARALAYIAEVLAVAGKTDEAFKIAGSLKSEGHKAQALAYIAEVLATAGKTNEADPVFSEALETAGLIKNAHTKAKALRSIAKALAKAGNIDEALKTARSIKITDFKALALENIAEVLATAGKTNEADPIFSEALKTAGLIKNAHTKAWALANIAESLARAGKTEKADPVFSEAVKTAKSIKDVSVKTCVLADIADALARAGKTDEVAKLIKDTDDKARALRNIAEALAKAGKTEKALEIAETIKQSGTRKTCCRNIAVRLFQAELDKDQEKEFATRIMKTASPESTVCN